MPIPGFGSQQCTGRCKPHLVHFKEHPFVAVFRAGLSKRHPQHPPVYVDFVEASVQRVASKDVEVPIKEAYLRGRRYLEARRAAVPARTGSLSVIGNDPVGRRLLHKLAEAMRVDYSTMKKDTEFAEGVEVVIGECGEIAAKVFFNSTKPQARSAIEKISRKSRERQRYRIEGVLDGRMRSVAPQPSDRVPDTMKFRKIISRLARARGDVEVGLRLVEPAPQRLPKGHRGAILETAKRLSKQTRLLARVVAALQLVDSTADTTKITLGQARDEETGLKLNQVLGQLVAACTFVEKNIRDLPFKSDHINVHGNLCSSYDLRPTRAEIQRANKEMARIRAGCERLRDVLAG